MHVEVIGVSKRSDGMIDVCVRINGGSLVVMTLDPEYVCGCITNRDAVIEIIKRKLSLLYRNGKYVRNGDIILFSPADIYSGTMIMAEHVRYFVLRVGHVSIEKDGKRKYLSVPEWLVDGCCSE